MLTIVPFCGSTKPLVPSAVTTDVGTMFPSISISFVVTVVVTGVSSSVTSVSSTARISFTGSTVIVTKAVSQADGNGVPSSHTIYS